MQTQPLNNISQPHQQDSSRFSYAVMSHKGLTRQSNQDSYLTRQDLGLFIVADGMGGLDNGKIASEMTCNIVSRCIQNGEDTKSAIKSAHQVIQLMAKQLSPNKGMGTTIVSLKIEENRLNVSWVGDSRAYLFHKGELTQLTKDHSIVQMLLDRQLITKEDAKYHPERKLITQSIGMQCSRKLSVDSISLSKQMQGEVLLCSDGLTNELSDDQIKAILNKPLTLKAKINDLILSANKHGGKDNITAVLIASDHLLSS
jgi:protein phosphatase